MSAPAFYPRSIERRLAEALEDSPVVLIHGPRQCGKTTLAQLTCAPNYLRWGGDSLTWGGDRPSRGWSRQHRDYTYISFDDAGVREGARADPRGFVADLPERVVLDEIQRIPDLFEAIKVEVDRRRVPGRFVLTGSTNVLLLPQLSESLAGRLQVVRLHPLAQYELAARSAASPPEAGFLHALYGDGFAVRRTERLGERLIERIVAGGFAPALKRPTARRQAGWYRDYVEALIQRDVRDMTRIRSLDILPRLLSAAASQTARLFNLADLAGTVPGQPPDNRRLHDAAGEAVPAGAPSVLAQQPSEPPRQEPEAAHGRYRSCGGASRCEHRGAQGRSGAAGAASGNVRVPGTAQTGELARSADFVLPLPRQGRRRGGYRRRTWIASRRGGGGQGGGGRWTRTDFRGLRKLASATGDRFARGVVLYDGEAGIPFGDRLHAVPIRWLWETP